MKMGATDSYDQIYIIAGPGGEVNRLNGNKADRVKV